eukprot:8102356-Pyramimonas_sp.AAC.1
MEMAWRKFQAEIQAQDAQTERWLLSAASIRMLAGRTAESEDDTSSSTESHRSAGWIHTSRLGPWQTTRRRTWSSTDS